MLYNKSISYKHHLYIVISIVLLFGSILGITIGLKGLSPTIIIPIVAIPFLILTISRPAVAVFIFFLLVPLETIFVVEGSLTSTMTKLMGVYLVFLVVVKGYLKYINEVFKNVKALWILFFGAVAMVSVSYSRNTGYSMGYLITLWLSIILYFVLIMMIRNTRTLRLTTLALTTGAVLSILSPTVLGYGSTIEMAWNRYGGLWGDPNEFAAILLTLIPLSISLFLTSKTKIVKIIAAIYTVTLFTGFILTYSRGGFIAFGVMITLTMFKLIGGKNRLKILALSIPCIIVAFVVFYYAFADEFITRMETLRILQSQESVRAEGSLSLRYYYYFELAPKLFMENPILGVGFRGFKFHNIYNDVSHNTFLEVLTGMGILGFIPFVIILFLTWKDLRKVERVVARDENNAYLLSFAKALELGFLSYLVAGLFVTMDLTKMTWILIILASVAANISRIHNMPPPVKVDMSAGRWNKPETSPQGNYSRPEWIKY